MDYIALDLNFLSIDYGSYLCGDFCELFISLKYNPAFQRFLSLPRLSFRVFLSQGIPRSRRSFATLALPTTSFFNNCPVASNTVFMSISFRYFCLPHSFSLLIP